VQDQEVAGARRPLRPYLTVVLLMPLLASTLGVDGGAVFQIIAVEELGLSARAVGIAFGLGVLSVPVQLYAARMPLTRAAGNLRAFTAFGASAALVLAVIVAAAPDPGAVAYVALALTVAAEVAVSVLYATSWQPLLSYGLAASDRQRVSSRGRAAGGALLAAALVAFGLLSTSGRVVFIGVVAGGAVVMLLAVGRFAAPPRPDAGRPSGPEQQGPNLPAGILPVYLALGLAGIATWPLFLIYTREVLWPAANLGLVGAMQLAGSLGAAFAWTPSTGAGVIRRARVAAAVLAVSSAATLAVDAPVERPVEAVPVLVLLVVAAAATSIVLLALMELAHGTVTEQTSVRTMTYFDVVASTSFQMGLVCAGFLVEASRDTQRLLDPYRLYLVLTSIVLLGSVLRIRPRR
jgi:hypothetical protein